MIPINPFWGPKPEVGDRVYIDFGDSVTAHPEVEGLCVFIDDRFITVEIRPSETKRFRLDQCVHIEVV